MKGIFLYQSKLMERYEKTGAVPKMPMDINDRQNQKFIKGTIDDIIEELVEADVSYEQVAKKILTEDLRLLKNTLTDDLILYSEELSDALHFFIELFISVNIDGDEILDFYSVMLREENLHEALWVDEPLITSMRYAKYYVVKNTVISNLKARCYKALSDADIEKLKVAGYFLNPELLPFMVEYNWEITKKLKVARNKLKKKEWRKSNVDTELRPFYTKIMEAWICFTILLDLVGMDEKSIYRQYENKNIINQQRIESEY